MELTPIDAALLEESELDTISGGRVCNQGPRMEVNIPFGGGEVLTIWATSTCSGAYWHMK